METIEAIRLGLTIGVALISCALIKIFLLSFKPNIPPPLELPLLTGVPAIIAAHVTNTYAHAIGCLLGLIQHIKS
jgi:hypothetical protein